MRIRTLAVFFLFLASPSFLISTSVFAGQYNTVLNIGDTMPDFTDLPGVAGKTLSAKDFTADVVVMVSLANHCPWVQGMDQGLVDLARSFSGKSVAVIGLSVNHREDDRLPAMIEHAKKNGYNFPYLYDESQKLGRDLGTTRTPEYFVFDKERKLVYMGLLTNSPAMKRGDTIRHINGEPTDFYVNDAITATLAGKPVNVTETRAHGCSVKYE